MEKPKTAKAIMDAIWFALFGLNGEDGLIFITKDTQRRVQAIEVKLPNLETHAEHEIAHAQHIAEDEVKEKQRDEKKERNGLSKREWIMIAIVAASIFVSPWLAHLLERKP